MAIRRAPAGVDHPRASGEPNPRARSRDLRAPARGDPATTNGLPAPSRMANRSRAYGAASQPHTLHDGRTTRALHECTSTRPHARARSGEPSARETEERRANHKPSIGKRQANPTFL